MPDTTDAPSGHVPARACGGTPLTCDEPEHWTPEPTREEQRAAALDLLAEAADAVNTALAGLADVPALDALHLLADLRKATAVLGQLDAALATHLYLHGEHGEQLVDGIGKVRIYRTREREQWAKPELARAVVDARMRAINGEVTDPHTVVDWLLEALAIDYARKTALRAIGLDPGDYYTSEPGVPKVSIT